MRNSMYHIVLRTSALTLAVTVLFVSGVLSPVTAELSRDTSAYLATAIGMNASVLPNEINTLSAQLEKRSQELAQREISVSLQEQTVGGTNTSTFVLSVLLFILLVLIILNYFLDYMRMHSQRAKIVQIKQAA